MRHDRIKVCMICCLFLALSVSHASSDTTYYRYTNGIVDILAAGNYIWCSTTAGVVRWNRHNGSYREFTINDGFPAQIPGKIGIDPEGSVWISWDGVRRYDEGSWVPIFVDLPDFTAFAAGPDGYIWLGVTGKGLVRIKGDEYEVLRMPDTFYPRRIYDIIVDSHGIVWVAAYTGVYRLDGDDWKRYKIDESQSTHPVHSLVEMNDTILALGNHGLAVWTEGEWEIIPQPYGFGVSSDSDMVVSPAGCIWFASQLRGIVTFDGTNWMRYTDENGSLPDDDVNKVVFDEDDAAWFSVYKHSATRGPTCGLYRFNGDSYDSYSPYHTIGPLDPTVLEVTVGKDNTVYFLGDSGISYFDGVHVAPFYTEADFKDVWYYELDGVVDSHGITWYGGPEGLRSFDGEKWNDFSNEECLKGKKTLSVSVDRNNVKWIGTDMGAVSFDGYNWKLHNAETDFTDEVVLNMITGPDGNIWSGTQEGVWKYEKDTWNLINSINTDFSSSVQTMAFDKTGVLWVAFYLGGILTFNGEQWENFNVYPVGSPQVYDMAVDNNGDMWLGTYNFGAVSIDLEKNDSTLVSDTQTQCLALDITGIYPNPFNANTTIEFSIDTAGFASLVVYNITGQKVRELINKTISPGIHTVVWDGRDAYGENLSSGIYLSELKIGHVRSTMRMILLK